MQYDVEYEENGAKKHENYMDVSNPGSAFAQCLKDHPGCKLIRCVAFGRQADLDKYGFTEYEPPAVQREPLRKPRPARALKRNEKGCEFSFYDEVKVKS